MTKILVRLFLIPCLLLLSCHKKEVAGWNYNKPSNGGFQKVPYAEQETPPGMVLVEGGTFLFKNENGTEKKSVNSFFISKTEETNGQYCAYLLWLKKYFSEATYRKALPDTMVWMKENISDSAKTYLTNYYLRHYVFSDYPVVGLNPEQIEKYCAWKTDRINEMILIREGIMDFDTMHTDSTNLFSTDAYLGGKYPTPKLVLIPDSPDKKGRPVRMEDGIFMPHVRLPQEEEWKVAALAQGDSNYTYVITEKEYNHRKFDKKNHYGFLYVKNRPLPSTYGALMIAQLKGPNAVYLLPQNNYGIYGMDGNVSEVVKKGKEDILIGGSWEKPGPDYSSVYDKTLKDSVKYANSHPFKSIPALSFTPSSAIGFRTAMSYLGYYSNNKLPFKRRKGKK